MPDCTFCQTAPATTRVYSEGYRLDCCAGCAEVWQISEAAADDLWQGLLHQEPQLKALVTRRELQEHGTQKVHI